jgi:hypothetical protein
MEHSTDSGGNFVANLGRLVVGVELARQFSKASPKEDHTMQAGMAKLGEVQATVGAVFAVIFGMVFIGVAVMVFNSPSTAKQQGAKKYVFPGILGLLGLLFMIGGPAQAYMTMHNPRYAAAVGASSVISATLGQ